MSKTLSTIPFDWQPPSATMTSEQLRSLRLPEAPLKMQPQHGVFLWWPADPNMWAHPNDFETIRRFVPGSRVFWRDSSPDYSDRALGFVVYRYGIIRFRAKPILWREVKPEGYYPGDRVEIKSRHGKSRPRVAKIVETLWNPHARKIEYVVDCRGMKLTKTYSFDDLRPVIPLGAHMPVKHLDLARTQYVL